jgi:uncharacterized protein
LTDEATLEAGLDCLLEHVPLELESKLGQLLLDRLLAIYEIEEADYNCLLRLMKKYRDRPMDLADATLVLAAEKTGYREILTLDSDFLFYRIGDRDSFDVIQVQ